MLLALILKWINFFYDFKIVKLVLYDQMLQYEKNRYCVIKAYNIQLVPTSKHTFLWVVLCIAL